MWKICWMSAPFGLLQSKTLRALGIDVSYETVRLWWNRFGLLFVAEIPRKRASRMRAYSNWQWHLDDGAVRQDMPACPRGFS
jgi:transposase-like protein